MNIQNEFSRLTDEEAVREFRNKVNDLNGLSSLLASRNISTEIVEVTTIRTITTGASGKLYNARISRVL